MKQRHSWGLRLLLLVSGIMLGAIGIVSANEYQYHQRDQVSAEQPIQLTSVANQANQTRVTQVKRFMRDHHLLGTVEMIRHGQKLTVHVGDANHRLHQKNNIQRPFPICSITKFLTGVMIEQLVAEHRLSMNTTLNHFYPKVPMAKQITVRELLDHDSGISMPEKTPEHILETQNQGVAYSIQNLRVHHRHSWQYSGANFTLLAGILSQVTHKSYATNLSQRIVTPLGLQHTAVWTSKNGANLASYTYHHKNYTQLTHFNSRLASSELGGANVLTSPDDLTKIGQAIIHGQLLSNTEFTQLAANFKANPLYQNYAGGIYHTGPNVAFVFGSDNHFQSSLFINLNTGNSTVVNLNQGSYATSKRLGIIAAK